MHGRPPGHRTAPAGLHMCDRSVRSSRALPRRSAHPSASEHVAGAPPTRRSPSERLGQPLHGPRPSRPLTCALSRAHRRPRHPEPQKKASRLPAQEAQQGEHSSERASGPTEPLSQPREGSAEALPGPQAPEAPLPAEDREGAANAAAVGVAIARGSVEQTAVDANILIVCEPKVPREITPVDPPARERALQEGHGRLSGDPKPEIVVAGDPKPMVKAAHGLENLPPGEHGTLGDEVAAHERLHVPGTVREASAESSDRGPGRGRPRRRHPRTRGRPRSEPDAPAGSRASPGAIGRPRPERRSGRSWRAPGTGFAPSSPRGSVRLEPSIRQRPPTVPPGAWAAAVSPLPSEDPLSKNRSSQFASVWPLMDARASPRYGPPFRQTSMMETSGL